MSKRLRVLLVEDSENDAKLILLELRRGGYDVISMRVETATTMEDALTTQEWDVVISDYTLPGFSGLNAFTLMKSKGFDIPFIIVSGTIGEEVAIDAMKFGAHDYVMKNNLKRLVPAITREIQDAGIRWKQKLIERELYEREQRYRNLFENSPISLWEEDFSEIKKYLDKLRCNGVREFQAYFTENPDEVGECARKVKIINVNNTTLNLFECSSKSQMLENIQKTFIKESYQTFKEEIIALSRDPATFEAETTLCTLAGAKRNVIIRVFIALEYHETWEKVLISILDISERKRIEDALRQEITERKQIEEALRKSQTTLLEAQAIAHICSWEYDLVTMKEIWSNEMFRILGKDPVTAEASPIAWHRTIHPDDWNRIDSAMQNLIKKGILFNQEFRIVIPDGTSHWGWMLGKPVMDKDGKVAKVYGTLQDTSERKAAEEALRESEARLKEAQALGRIGSWVFNIETQKIMWSDQTFKLYDRDPLLGPPLLAEESTYYSPQQVQTLQQYGRRAIEEGKEFKYDLEANLPSGKHTFFSVTMRPIKDKNGRIAKLFGTVQDITERKLAEEELRQMNQFLDSIIDNIPLIITVKNAHTLTYQRVNRAFEQLINRSSREIEGKTVEDLFSPAEAKDISNYDSMVIQKKLISEAEEKRTGADRIDRIYRIKRIPIINANGDVEILLSIAEDVTVQNNVEQERQKLLEKTLQISDLKSNIITQAAHELKTPLIAILGWGELLYAAKKDGKSLDTAFNFEDIATIVHSAERLDALINNFLDAGRIDSGKFELDKKRNDFSEIIENATRIVDNLATQKSISFPTVKVPSVFISVDHRRMEQVMVHLLSNAVKYSPEHTHVTIKTDLIETSGRKMFEVQVIDEGYGFTPEELVEATTSFGKAYTIQEQKRTVQGAGFGLLICRRIIEQHGGTLEIRSNGADQGTQVIIRLPLE